MKPSTTTGRNTGKKYIKLRGHEVPTPQNELRAREFMTWYAANMQKLERYAQGSGGILDADIFSDTFLRLYDDIALKGLNINNYTAYFLRAYRTKYIDSRKGITDDLDTDIADPVFDSKLYEEVVETLSAEVFEYVRGRYDDVSISLFEIYIGLAPEVSYKRLANMLGIPEFKVWPAIGKIKKDVAAKFGHRKNVLLSLVDY